MHFNNDSYQSNLIKLSQCILKSWTWEEIFWCSSFQIKAMTELLIAGAGVQQTQNQSVFLQVFSELPLSCFQTWTLQFPAHSRRVMFCHYLKYSVLNQRAAWIEHAECSILPVVKSPENDPFYYHLGSTAASYSCITELPS